MDFGFRIGDCRFRIGDCGLGECTYSLFHTLTNKLSDCNFICLVIVFLFVRQEPVGRDCFAPSACGRQARNDYLGRFAMLINEKSHCEQSMLKACEAKQSHMHHSLFLTLTNNFINYNLISLITKFRFA